MSNISGTALIREQSSTTTSEIDNSFKIKKNYIDNGNLLNVQSVVLGKLLDDPDMQEVVVMEVYISNSIK
jgi:hypothetical protein